jgi:hypothetical protein
MDDEIEIIKIVESQDVVFLYEKKEVNQVFNIFFIKINSFLNFFLNIYLREIQFKTMFRRFT